MGILIGQLLVCGADLRRQRLRYRCVVEQLTRGNTRRLQCRGVLNVHDAQQVRQFLAQAGLRAERSVCGGADDEAVWHGQSRGSELAEVRALAAGIVDIVARQISEQTDRVVGQWGRLYVGDGHLLIAPPVGSPAVVKTSQAVTNGHYHRALH